MIDAVLFSTVLALREARAVVAALALLHGADALAGRGGERRRVRVCQSRWRTCGEKKRMPREPMHIDAGARPSTLLRGRKEY
jgi:hypothetical protein